MHRPFAVTALALRKKHRVPSQKKRIQTTFTQLPSRTREDLQHLAEKNSELHAARFVRR